MGTQIGVGGFPAIEDAAPSMEEQSGKVNMQKVRGHTPGPWRCFYKAKYNEWHVSLPVTGGSMRLALCPDGIQSEHPEADARLIAAAPDMLAVLEGVRDWADSIASPAPIFQAVRAAISRARGQM